VYSCKAMFTSAHVGLDSSHVGRCDPPPPLIKPPVVFKLLARTCSITRPRGYDLLIVQHSNGLNVTQLEDHCRSTVECQDAVHATEGGAGYIRESIWCTECDHAAISRQGHISLNTFRCNFQSHVRSDLMNCRIMSTMSMY
jgi:hypothetical protein